MERAFDYESNCVSSILTSCYYYFFMFSFFVSKGRIAKLFLKYLSSKNVFIVPNDGEEKVNKRGMIFNTNTQIKISYIRSGDFVLYINKGICDCCLVGYDIYKEMKPYINNINDFIVKKVYNIFSCRLSIISRNKYSFLRKYLSKESGLNIFSKYKSISKNFFLNKKGFIDCSFTRVKGCVELPLVLNLCDYIVDIVDTGRTIISNNLIEIDKIIDVYPVIIFKRNCCSELLNILNSVFDFC